MSTPSDRPAAHYRTKFLDFDARREPKTDHYCARCQKDICGSYRCIHLVDGGAFILHPEDEAVYAATGKAGGSDDCGAHFLGSDCARKLGLEWSRPT